MRSTMMDVPLTVTALMRYGTSAYGERLVVTATEDATRSPDVRGNRAPGGPAGRRAAQARR